MENDKNSVKTTKNSKIYSANELCNIIKACSKNGVTNLKISGIEINFMDQGTDSPQAGMTWTPQKKVSAKPADTTPIKPLELTEKDLKEIEDLERTQQVIDDPVGYEEQVIKDFMENEANNEVNGYN